MSTAIHQLRASYAFAERNWNLVRRYWAWELVWLVYSIANSLSVSYIGLGMGVLTGEPDPVESKFLVLYLLIGTLVWRYLSSIFYWVTEVIAIERWEGTIEYTLMAPVRRIVHLVGHTSFAVVYSVAFTAVILGVTALMFDLDLARANLFGGLLMLLAGSFSFVGVGVMGAVLPLLFPERGAQMTHIIVATLLLISGVYYPVEVLPAFLQKLAPRPAGPQRITLSDRSSPGDWAGLSDPCLPGVWDTATPASSSSFCSWSWPARELPSLSAWPADCRTRATVTC
jgi:ABC-2 type transport system permease protein